jgi:hypothetical protein
MPDTKDHLTHLEQLRQEALDSLHQLYQQSPQVTTPQEFESLERNIQSVCLKIADLTTAIVLQRSLDSEELRNEGKELIKSLGIQRICKGLHSITIRFAGGSEIVLKASYWARKHFEGRRGQGLFPELCLLGVHHRCSPLLASRVALASSSLGSFKEAQHTLSEHGCHLDIKTIIRITKALGKYARMGCQNLPLHNLENHDLQGRKVVVALDGGRLRIRRTKRGPKTKKGRNRYTTYWKEPKLLIVYVSRPDGRIDKGFLPLIDGTLEGPDAIFALLYRHLCLLNIGTADHVLFVADGAPWIWERIRLLRLLFQLKGIMLNTSELIDFYHAAQHLHAFSSFKSGWSDKERKRWVNKQKRELKLGKIENVVAAMQTAAKGSKSEKLRRELNYFLKNRHRFEYDQVRALGLPIGSGAIESAIRRVINLRLKGPCLYWTEETAEEMILLRSYYKSGRWDEIKALSNEGVLAHAA